MCSFFQHIFLVESFSIPGIILGSRGKTINKVTILKEYKFLKVEMVVTNDVKKRKYGRRYSK